MIKDISFVEDCMDARMDDALSDMTDEFKLPMPDEETMMNLRHNIMQGLFIAYWDDFTSSLIARLLFHPEYQDVALEVSRATQASA